MAKPATTHVIEIESGIGEPAFIPLTLGQELQPISVGKKGMWRVEGARVLDVHAFVYFDGNALFLQSADEGTPAVVDGYKVGKAWTELHAPCRIEVGASRLRFRSLVAADPAHAATVAQAAPPVRAPPGGPGGAPAPAPSEPQPSGGGGGRASAPPRPAPLPAAGRRPDPMPMPVTLPKPDRPFAPGQLASHPPDGESTRIGPVAPSGSMQAFNAASPRPAAGRPVEEDLSTHREAARGPGLRDTRPPTGQVAAAHGSGSYQAVQGQPPVPGMVQGVMPLGTPPGGLAQSGMQPGMQGSIPPALQQTRFAPNTPSAMHPGMQGSIPPGMQPGAPFGMPSGSMSPGMPPAGYGYPQPGPSQPPGYPQPGPSQPPGYPPGQSGAFRAIPPGGPSMAPGGYGSPTPNPSAPNPSGGLQSFSEVMKDPSQRKKLLALSIVLLGGAYLLFDEDPPPPPKKPVAALDGGLRAEGGAGTAALASASARAGTPATAAATSAASAATAPTAPPPAPCPQGFQPYGEIRPGAPITCVPIPGPNDAGASVSASSDGGALGGGPPVAGSSAALDAGKATPTKVASGQKTLERQAIDYVAIGEYQKAIGVYEQLSRQSPDKKEYAEALRILRQKLDAGTQ